MNDIVKYYPILLQKARKYAKIFCIKAMKGRSEMSKKTTLAVIGVGNMASAIIGGILSSDGATGITGDSAGSLQPHAGKSREIREIRRTYRENRGGSRRKGRLHTTCGQAAEHPRPYFGHCGNRHDRQGFHLDLRRNIERYHLREARAEGSGSPSDAEYAVTDRARGERRRAK